MDNSTDRRSTVPLDGLRELTGRECTLVENLVLLPQRPTPAHGAAVRARFRNTHITVEEPCAAARRLPPHGLRVASPCHAREVVSPLQSRRLSAHVTPQLEGGVDEPVGSPADFALGKRPEFDRLGPTRKRVGPAGPPSGPGEDRLGKGGPVRGEFGTDALETLPTGRLADWPAGRGSGRWS
jgi:hypothetical protein